MDKELIAKIRKDWTNAIPSLKAHSRLRFYKIVGPFVTGLQINRRPYEEEYAPYFVVYPLWKENVRESLDEPAIYFEIKDARNLQYFIPYTKHSEYFDDCLASVLRESIISFSGDVKLSELLQGVDNFIEYEHSHGSPGEAKLLRFKIFCALYVGDFITVDQLMVEAVAKRNVWNLLGFKYWFGGYNKWLQGVRDQVENRETFLEQIRVNRMDKKLARLNYSELTA